MAASTSVSSASSETITVEEVIKFHQQRLHCMGELGFEMGYPNIEEPFNNFNQDIYSPAEDEQAVISAMQSTTEDLRQLQRQEKLLRKNSSVVAQAESMLNDELKRLGRSARYIAAQSLSKKVKEVTESKHPKLKPNYVSVSVVRPSPGNTSISPANWIGVNLPLEGNVYEVHQVLRSVMKGDCMERCLDTGLNPKVWDEPHLKWKYQLLAANRPQLLEESSAKLETNKDWEALCAALTDENHVSKVLSNMLPGIMKSLKGLLRKKPDDAVLTETTYRCPRLRELAFQHYHQSQRTRSRH